MKTDGGENWRRTGCYGLRPWFCEWDMLCCAGIPRFMYANEKEGMD